METICVINSYQSFLEFGVCYGFWSAVAVWVLFNFSFLGGCHVGVCPVFDTLVAERVALLLHQFILLSSLTVWFICLSCWLIVLEGPWVFAMEIPLFDPPLVSLARWLIILLTTSTYNLFFLADGAGAYCGAKVGW